MRSTLQEIRRLSRAEPFEPFVVHLENGRQVRVAHPEALASRRPLRSMAVFQPDDTLDLVDLALVARVEPSR
jgi:hypothetical protein